MSSYIAVPISSWILIPSEHSLGLSIADRQLLQSTSRIIVDINLQRNTEVEEPLQSWAELREQRSVHGNSRMLTDGDGYWDLTETSGWAQALSSM